MSQSEEKTLPREGGGGEGEGEGGSTENSPEQPNTQDVFFKALKCLNWLPLAGRRLSHRCTAVENAIKGDILKALNRH